MVTLFSAWAYPPPVSRMDTGPWSCRARGGGGAHLSAVVCGSDGVAPDVEASGLAARIVLARAVYYWIFSKSNPPSFRRF